MSNPNNVEYSRNRAAYNCTCCTADQVRWLIAKVLQSARRSLSHSLEATVASLTSDKPYLIVRSARVIYAGTYSDLPGEGYRIISTGRWLNEMLGSLPQLEYSRRLISYSVAGATSEQRRALHRQLRVTGANAAFVSEDEAAMGGYTYLDVDRHGAIMVTNLPYNNHVKLEDWLADLAMYIDQTAVSTGPADTESTIATTTEVTTMDFSRRSVAYDCTAATPEQVDALMDALIAAGAGNRDEGFDSTRRFAKGSSYPFIRVDSYGDTNSVGAGVASGFTRIATVEWVAGLGAQANQPTKVEVQLGTKIDMRGASAGVWYAVMDWANEDHRTWGSSRERTERGAEDKYAGMRVDTDGELMLCQGVSAFSFTWRDVLQTMAAAEAAPVFAPWHVHLTTDMTINKLEEIRQALADDSRTDIPLSDVVTAVSIGTIGVNRYRGIVTRPVGRCRTDF